VRQHVAAAVHIPAASLTVSELDAALDGVDSHRSRRPSFGSHPHLSRTSVSSLLTASDTARYGPPEAVPSTQACRDALAAAEAILTGR
jgi:hypothetical protein